MKFTVLKQGLLLISVPLVVHVLFVGILARMQHASVAANYWSAHTKAVISQATTTLAQLIDTQTGLRGWALTGGPEFGRPFVRSAQSLPAEIDRLAPMVSDNPPQQARAEALARNCREMLAWQKKIGAMLADGHLDDAVAAIRSGRGNRMMQQIREQVDEFVRAENQLDVARLQHVRDTSTQMHWVLTAGLLVSIFVSAALLYFFSSRIGRRLSVMIENARRFADHEPLAEPVGGSDEIAQLDHVFHVMADSLDKSAERDRRYTEELEQKVAERVQDLARVNRELRHQNQENEMFVYSVSHDLRSPLVNLQGFSRELSYSCESMLGVLAESDLPDAARGRIVAIIDGEIGESIEFIQTAVTRLSNIIDALLRLSRVGRIEYQWQDVEIGPILERIVDSLQNSLNERGGRVLVADVPSAWGDPTAIEQIFGNLLVNAVNYLDPSRPGLIEVGCLTDGEAAAAHTYYVRDNGLGIPETHQVKLFKAFQRLHPNHAKGEGMGLAMVRRIVERHGGRIWVESISGEGSTFFVSLPADSSQSAKNRYLQFGERSREDDDAVVSHTAGGR